MNQADVDLSDCAILIFASSCIRIVLLSFLITLEGMILSVATKGDKVHLLIGFIGLSMLPTISSNTGASS